MSPIPSTSRAIIPPPLTTTSDSTATTPRRSQLSRKGKEKAIYTPPSYDFDDLSQGLYQPRSGQLQRRKTARGKSNLSSTGAAARRGRRKSNAEGALGVETIRVGATLEKKQEETEDGIHSEGPPKKKRKKKDQDSSTTLTKPKKRILQPPTTDLEDPSSQPDLLSPSSSRLPKQLRSSRKTKESSPLVSKKKKSVRLDLPLPLPSTSSSSDNELSANDRDVFHPDSEDDQQADPAISPRSRRITRSSSNLPSTQPSEDAHEQEELSLLLREEALDYSNPLNLPRTSLGNQQRRTSKKYWRGLEYGVYRSALADAVSGDGGENDLARLIWGWEELVRREKRREEQEQELVVEEGDEGKEGEIKEEKKKKKKIGRPRLPRASQRERERSVPITPRTPRRRTRSSTAGGYSSATGVGDEEDETGFEEAQRDNFVATGQEEEGEEDDEPKLALPTSQVLNQMARWPLYPTELINYSLQSGQRIDLHEELEILAEQTRRNNLRSSSSSQIEAAPPPLRRNRRPKIPSAYSRNPSQSLEPEDTEQDDSDSDSFSTSSLDISLPPPMYPPSFLQIPQTITSVLSRLSDFVPKEPLPALDIWSVRAREEGMRIDWEARKKEGKKNTMDEAPGWEEVVRVARENETIPKHVVDKLEQQLREMYGDSSEETEQSSMPPVGGEPVFPHFEPKVKKVRVRRKKRTHNEAEEARTGEGAIVETDTADAGLQTNDARDVGDDSRHGSTLSQPDGTLSANEEEDDPMQRDD